MALSSDLISQFAKITKDKEEKKNETTVYGTVTESGYVQLDGSDVLTPVISTVDAKPGERVIVMLKDHTATITGNISSPAVRTETVNIVVDNVTEMETVLADKVSTDELDVEKARIDKLEADNAEVSELAADYAVLKTTITENFTAINADIDKLEVNKLDVDTAKTTYATIENLNSTNAKIDKLDVTYASVENLNAVSADVGILEADYGEFKIATANNFSSVNATVNDLKANKLSAKDIEGKYANIDFSNISEATMANFYANSGLIEDVVIGDATISGKLVGVTISGGLIEAGTLVADKLVLLGNDGLYYKLNTDGVTTEAQQTDYNSINGSVITANSITASKISVDDLVAFDATIGGFNITSSSLYSGVKSSIGNTTRGIYLDNDGQAAFGDASNYIKYYKDTDNTYKLVISADSISFGSTDVESAIATAKSEAISTANTNTTNSLKNYSTTAQMNAAIELESDNITSSVSNTYATKTALADTDKNVILLNGDPSNYAKLNNETAEYWGFTYDSTEDGNWYTLKTLKRDTYVSNFYECVGGEQYKVEFEVSSSAKAVTSQNSSDINYANINVGLYCKKDSGSHYYAWPTLLGCISSEEAPATKASGIITIPTDAKKFNIALQIAGWSNFSGTVKIRNLRVSKLAAIETRVTSAESKITQNEEGITSLVNRTTTVENKFGNYSTTSEMNSAIEQKANSITSSVSSTYATKSALATTDTKVATAQSTAENAQNDIDNLEFGGRNLFLNTNKGTTGWSMNRKDGAYTLSGEEMLGVRGVSIDITEESSSWSIIRYYTSFILFDKLQPSSDYTISFDLYSSVDLGSTLITLKRGDSTQAYTNNASIPPVLKETWTKVSVTLTTVDELPALNDQELYWSSINTIGTYKICNLKLEKGNRRSDWSPAPEDTDADISALDTRVTSAESSISQNANSIATNVTEITNLGSRMSTVEQTASDLTVRIVAAESGITTAQSTANTAKTNAAAAAKTATDYLNLSSAGLVVGQNPSNPTAGNTLISTDGVSIRKGTTVLAAFKAASRTASGISSATLTSSNITDSESDGATKVTGTVSKNETRANVYITTNGNPVYFAKGLETDKVLINNSSGIIANCNIVLDGSLVDDTGEGILTPRNSYGNMVIGYGRYQDGGGTHIYGDVVKAKTISGFSASVNGAAAIETNNASGNATFGWHLYEAGSGETNIYGNIASLVSKSDMRLNANGNYIRFDGNIVPYTGNTYNIGTPSLSIHDIYISCNDDNTTHGLKFSNTSGSALAVGINADGYRIFGNSDYCTNIVTKSTTTTNTGYSFKITCGENPALTVEDNDARLLLYGGTDSTSRYLGSMAVYKRTYTGAANVHVTTNGMIGRSTSSSIRYKKDIVDLDLNTVKCLYDMPVRQFKYRDECIATEDERYGLDIPGFIAEEVAEYLPIACDHILDENGESVPEMWNSKVIIPAMLKLIQDLNIRVKELEEVKENQNG